MPNAVLSLNAGSSSIKFALFDTAADPVLRCRGEIEAMGEAPHFTAHDAAGKLCGERHWPAADPPTLFAFLLEWIEAHLGADRLIAVGHRVVHGGASFSAPVRITAPVLAALEDLIPLAPLHQPDSLTAIHAVAHLRPDVPQIACFDTAFHHTMPDVATRLPLPPGLVDPPLRRYGFHGLSYEHIARRLRAIAPALAAGRVIAAHLGSGASLCAIVDGRSIETTMGLTPLDGLLMSTRCGAIDPGVLLYLLQSHGFSPQSLSDLLYHRAGLRGVSGESGDMRVLLRSNSVESAQAVALFCYQVLREAGAMAAIMGGLDAIIFTGGIGEHLPQVRARICAGLAVFGVILDPAANNANAPLISTPASRVALRVIPADEERMIALHTIQMTR